MKKILVLFGSPHKNGKTAEMLDLFLKLFPGNCEIKFFSAFKMDIKPCIDCGYCKRNVGCIKHDSDVFMNAFEEADIVVIASPIYNFSFPAPVKSILDRFQRYFNARFSRGEKPSIKKRKRAVLLMTCGSNEKEGFEISVHQLKRAFTVLNTELVSSVLLSGTDKETDIPQDKLISVFNKLNL